MAHERPDPLRVLAARYRASQAGRTGSSTRDFTLDYKELQLGDTAAQIEAEELLRRAAAHSGGLLLLETHPRDPRLILLVRLARDGGEAWLFAQIGESSPTQERAELAAIFDSFRESTLPTDWLANLSCQSLNGGSIHPFRRDAPEGNRELLTILARVIVWEGESLLRFASCVICHDSKRLENLKSPLEAALRQINGQTFEDLGLLEKPRQVLMHGPLRLDGLDFVSLRGAVTISETDIHAADFITCSATRILTIENETTFLELVKLNRGDSLLFQTSHANRALVSTMARLPADLPAFHFGDTDPAGFDILRTLREKTGRPFQPLHMRFRPRSDAPALTAEETKLITRLLADPRMADCHEALDAMKAAGNKGDFEQESLGRPVLQGWPFYA
ncbi:MAG: DUF2220 family protein [Prosthecobacter sp.]|nr:DUF2220 family protein [Prosthecobacter sp.]